MSIFSELKIWDLMGESSFLPGCVVKEHVHFLPVACLCALYMNKGKEFGAIGGVGERQTNGYNHLGSTILSWTQM